MKTLVSEGPRFQLATMRLLNMHLQRFDGMSDNFALEPPFGLWEELSEKLGVPCHVSKSMKVLEGSTFGAGDVLLDRSNGKGNCIEGRFNIWCRRCFARS